MRTGVTKTRGKDVAANAVSLLVGGGEGISGGLMKIGRLSEKH